MIKIPRQAGRYISVGLIVFGFEILVIWLGQKAGLSPVLAVAIAFVSGTLLSFLLQKFFTFGDKRTRHVVVGLQLLATGLLVLFNFGFTVLATALLQDIFPAILIRSMALAITTVWNFYLYRTHIFSNEVPRLTSSGVANEDNR
ncbi:MAG: hypothetical protein QG629_440 [Patescibacteria group bacterium]|nr:GtrA family protein [Candidatus Saccharibacteria bacterium]MDQ5963358.1 hypothetical protein [Patescibacteria group bacterium]